MKLRKIATAAIITVTAIMLTGCQDELKQQLTDCQDNNTRLESSLKTQQEEVEKLKKMDETFGFTLIQAIQKNEALQKENEQLKKDITNLKAKMVIEEKTKDLTPAEKERIKKEGLQRLFELQRKSAEKMRLEKLKKEGKK
ncbi:MAG: hypothetical protein K9M75_13100 [Phycisphaerae bacterium]|nr:hypothetical protein [Phycisphaerae bacterium]